MFHIFIKSSSSNWWVPVEYQSVNEGTKWPNYFRPFGRNDRWIRIAPKFKLNTSLSSVFSFVLIIVWISYRPLVMNGGRLLSESVKFSIYKWPCENTSIRKINYLCQWLNALLTVNGQGRKRFVYGLSPLRNMSMIADVIPPLPKYEHKSMVTLRKPPNTLKRLFRLFTRVSRTCHHYGNEDDYISIQKVKSLECSWAIHVQISVLTVGSAADEHAYYICSHGLLCPWPNKLDSAHILRFQRILCTDRKCDIHSDK